MMFDSGKADIELDLAKVMWSFPNISTNIYFNWLKNCTFCSVLSIFCIWEREKIVLSEGGLIFILWFLTKLFSCMYSQELINLI